jgi:hypothetical protein
MQQYVVMLCYISIICTNDFDLRIYMPQRSLEIISARNEFYLTNYRRLVIVNFGLIGLILALIGYYYYQSYTNITHEYFPTTPDGMVIEMPPVQYNHLQFKYLSYDDKGYFKNSPQINEDVLKKDLGTDQLDPSTALIAYWAKQAVIDSYNYDYINYKLALQNSRDYYTGAGHAKFINDLIKSNNLQSIVKYKHVVSVKPIGIPEVTEIAPIQGHFAWQVIVPFDITFDNGVDVKIEEKWQAYLIVVRVDTLRSPFWGLAINSAIFGPR